MGVQISDFDLDDDLASAINLNLTVGSASAPLVATPGLNSTVVTVRSAQSVADIVKYNITSCMVSSLRFPNVLGYGLFSARALLAVLHARPSMRSLSSDVPVLILTSMSRCTSERASRGQHTLKLMR